jgi:hypothetical protein
LLFKYERAKKRLTEWFANGNKRTEKVLISTENLYQFKLEQYWNEQGIWLMTVKDKSFFEFNEDYLLENSSDLTTEDEEEVFISFSKYLLENKLEIGLKYLQKHTTHSNPFFRYQSARLLSNTNDINSIPFLEKLLNDTLQPETEMKIDWHGSGHSKKTQYPISRMAEIAIENIANNKGGS